MIVSRLLLLFLFVAASNWVAPGQTSDTRRLADEARIREASEEWGRAALSRNLDKAVSFYAEDASYFPPGAPVVVGKEAIRKAWADFLAIPGMMLKTTTKKVDVARSGDLAYEVGIWDMTVNDKEGKPVNSIGKYVVVWKKQPSGDWKAVVDIDNSDQ